MMKKFLLLMICFLNFSLLASDRSASSAKDKGTSDSMLTMDVAEGSEEKSASANDDVSETSSSSSAGGAATSTTTSSTESRQDGSPDQAVGAVVAGGTSVTPRATTQATKPTDSSGQQASAAANAAVSGASSSSSTGGATISTTTSSTESRQDGSPDQAVGAVVAGGTSVTPSATTQAAKPIDSSGQQASAAADTAVSGASSSSSTGGAATSSSTSGTESRQDGSPDQAVGAVVAGGTSVIPSATTQADKPTDSSGQQASAAANAAVSEASSSSSAGGAATSSSTSSTESRQDGSPDQAVGAVVAGGGSVAPSATTQADKPTDSSGQQASAAANAAVSEASSSSSAGGAATSSSTSGAESRQDGSPDQAVGTAIAGGTSVTPSATSGSTPQPGLISRGFSALIGAGRSALVSTLGAMLPSVTADDFDTVQPPLSSADGASAPQVSAPNLGGAAASTSITAQQATSSTSSQGASSATQGGGVSQQAQETVIIPAAQVQQFFTADGKEFDDIFEQILNNYLLNKHDIDKILVEEGSSKTELGTMVDKLLDPQADSQRDIPHGKIRARIVAAIAHEHRSSKSVLNEPRAITKALIDDALTGKAAVQDVKKYFAAGAYLGASPLDEQRSMTVVQYLAQHVQGPHKAKAQELHALFIVSQPSTTSQEGVNVSAQGNNGAHQQAPVKTIKHEDVIAILRAPVDSLPFYANYLKGEYQRNKYDIDRVAFEGSRSGEQPSMLGEYLEGILRDTVSVANAPHCRLYARIIAAIAYDHRSKKSALNSPRAITKALIDDALIGSVSIQYVQRFFGQKCYSVDSPIDERGNETVAQYLVNRANGLRISDVAFVVQGLYTQRAIQICKGLQIPLVSASSSSSSSSSETPERRFVTLFSKAFTANKNDFDECENYYKQRKFDVDAIPFHENGTQSVGSLFDRSKELPLGRLNPFSRLFKENRKKSSNGESRRDKLCNYVARVLNAGDDRQLELAITALNNDLDLLRQELKGAECNIDDICYDLIRNSAGQVVTRSLAEMLDREEKAGNVRAQLVLACFYSVRANNQNLMSPQQMLSLHLEKASKDRGSFNDFKRFYTYCPVNLDVDEIVQRYLPVGISCSWGTELNCRLKRSGYSGNDLEILKVVQRSRCCVNSVLSVLMSNAVNGSPSYVPAVADWVTTFNIPADLELLIDVDLDKAGGAVVSRRELMSVQEFFDKNNLEFTEVATASRVSSDSVNGASLTSSSDSSISSNDDLSGDDEQIVTGGSLGTPAQGNQTAKRSGVDSTTTRGNKHDSPEKGGLGNYFTPRNILVAAGVIGLAYYGYKKLYMGKQQGDVEYSRYESVAA